MAAGQPLPSAWPILEEKRALIRRGALSMLGGRPGSMKTITLLNIALLTGVPTLYFSSDSDDYTVASRVLAHQTGKPSSETEQWLKNNQGFASNILRGADHIKWCFNSSPTIQDLYEELDAFAEIHGQYPHMLVIDILMDIDDGSGAVDQNYWTTMQELKIMAHETQSAIVIAHHTTEAVKGDPCQPVDALMGKASQLQTLIITLAGDSQNGRLHMSVVKNRHGKSDRTGSSYFTLAVDPEVCRVTSLPEGESTYVSTVGPWTGER